jgi:hypothetical protein
LEDEPVSTSLAGIFAESTPVLGRIFDELITVRINTRIVCKYASSPRFPWLIWIIWLAVIDSSVIVIG